MLTRLTHASIAFALTALVYQFYVILAVPFVDPVQAAIVEEEETEEETRPRIIPHKYRELFASYFPENHWTLTDPPKTFESNRLMIVLDDYQSSDDGQVRINKCAFLFFRGAKFDGDNPPLDAIVLEAPHGAVLQMDEGFRPQLGNFGRIQWGKLLGDITVRSDMSSPGPEDDLLLTTRDLYIREGFIRTEAQVKMRIGPHFGQGSVMEIRFLPQESSKTTSLGLSSAGIESLEILEDVEAQIVPRNVQVFSSSSASQATSPIQISCADRFRFSFLHNQATFHNQVRVEQVHPTGLKDQMLCNELSLFLASVPTISNEASMKLLPASIMAVGKEGLPVIVNAPSHQATARCERLWLELQARRITLDGSDEVMLSYQGSEIHAPLIRYAAPETNSEERLGNLLAAGSGWIRAMTGRDQDSKSIEIRWTKELRMQRIAGQPVLTLRGRPRLEMIGLGQLWSDELEMYLRERALDGSEDQLLPSDVVPQRIVATGQIAIDSEQLHGKVRQLEVDLKYTPIGLVLGNPDGLQGTRAQDLLRKNRTKRARTYDIHGQELKMLLTVTDGEPEVTSIDLDKNVVFRELASEQNSSKQPMVVHANHLQVLQANSANAVISVQGKPAKITAAGMSIRAEDMSLNRGSSQAEINSAGQLEIPIDRDLSGKVLSSPQLMSVTWQGGMNLDQDLITFSKDVEVVAGEGWLKTEELGVRLSSKVRFDGASSQQQAQLAELNCSRGAFSQYSQRDDRGLTSIQTMSIDDSLSINQLTGKIYGEGGGWLESVHLSKAGGLIGNTQQGTLPSQQLRYLKVAFVRGVEGNLNERHVAVLGNVDAIYGPVDSWQQKLKKSVSGMPGEDEFWINSQKLKVAESPLARTMKNKGMGPIELEASGNVTIEGRTGDKGSFTTRSQRASYDQLKTMFILEGNSAQPASLIHQEYLGALPSETAAKRIIYVHSSGEVKVEGIIRGGWKQFNLGQQPNGVQVR